MDTKVAVIGGGPAGVAISIALVSLGFKVTMVEKTEYGGISIGEHLLPMVTPLFVKLKIPQEVWGDRCFRCSEVRSIWGTAQLSFNEAIFHPYGRGVMITRPFFESQMAEHAKSRGAEILKNTSFLRSTRTKDGWDITLKRDDKVFNINSNFLVDASGRGAIVSQPLKAVLVKRDNLIGLTGYATPRRGQFIDDHSILIEACEDGWWFSSPLYDGRMVATYMTDSDILEDSGEKPFDLWKKRLKLGKYTFDRVDSFELNPAIRIRPSMSQVSTRIAGDGWLAVGDAAICCDPLAAAGIYNGFNMGINASQAIQSFFEGDNEALNRYEKMVKKEFKEYLKTRSYYYRRVTHWSKSEFWIRRHGKIEDDVSVYLDPRALVSKKEGNSFPANGDLLYDTESNIDINLLLKLAGSTQPVHELVTIYIKETNAKHMDQEIIIAIQFLLELGHLKLNA